MLLYGLGLCTQEGTKARGKSADEVSVRSVGSWDSYFLCCALQKRNQSAQQLAASQRSMRHAAWWDGVGTYRTEQAAVKGSMNSMSIQTKPKLMEGREEKGHACLGKCGNYLHTVK